MPIHIFLSYGGGTRKRDGRSFAAGKAIIEINKDNTWQLKTTPGGSDWWPDGADWYGGTYSGSDRKEFLNHQGEITFVLRNFNYPPYFISDVNDFYVSWIKTTNAAIYTGKWQPILTDELLKITLEEIELIQQEIIEMGIQGTLDAVSILDQSGATSLAAAGYALSRGAYLECGASLLGAIPLLGKFTGALSATGINSARLASQTKRLEQIRKAVEATQTLNQEYKLQKTVGVQKMILNDSRVTTTIREVANAAPEIKTAAKGRSAPGTVPRTSLVNKSGNWKGDGNAMQIPQQLADRLAGKACKTFDDLRIGFWKEVAKDEKLAKQFAYDARNLAEMKKGNAPFVKLEHQKALTKKGNYYKNYRSGTTHGQAEVLQRYALHHKTPIGKKGAIYDLANLLIVSPPYHLDILLRSVHYGSKAK